MQTARIIQVLLLLALMFIVTYGDDPSFVLIVFWGSWEFLMWSIDLAYRKVGAMVHGKYFMEV